MKDIMGKTNKTRTLDECMCYRKCKIVTVTYFTISALHKMEEIKQEYGMYIEPYRMKSVELIPFPSSDERAKILEEVHYDIAAIPADKVTIDLFSDSGLNGMTSSQWAALLTGDESYAGSASFYRLADTVKSITGYPELIPTHQGRAAERILYSFLVAKGDIAVSNSWFFTAFLSMKNRGVSTMDFLQYPDLNDPSTKEYAFKGNLDVVELEKFVAVDNKVKLVVMTVTNNTHCGLPVSMENIKETSAICRKYGITLILDACRYAENAYFIHRHEPGFKEMKIEDIALQMFSYADGCIMSTKKDGLCNIGGFIAVRDPDLALKCRQDCILTEGFPTYGGLTGRDMDAMAVGLREVLSLKFLSWRMDQFAYLAQLLEKSDIPVVQPVSSAVCIDGAAFLPHVPEHELPAWGLACEMYLKGGIRAMAHSRSKFVRLAVPRCLYSNVQLLYVSKVIADIYKKRDSVLGYEMINRELMNNKLKPIKKEVNK